MENLPRAAHERRHIRPPDIAALIRSAKCTLPHSRDLMRPSFSNRFAQKVRAWGMPGARCTRSRACKIDSTRVSHHGRTGITRHSRTRWCYGFLRALPGDRACLPPSPTDRSVDLTPASGRQNHTTSPSAIRALRQKRLRVHRIPCPTSVTMADAPPMGHGMAPYAGDLRWKKSRKFLRDGLDRGKQLERIDEFRCRARSL